MCRLFGLHADSGPVDADFWLTTAPDALEQQSRANPDGFGVGTFAEDGTPIVEKAPVAAWRDPGFAGAAHRLRGRTFIAHVRHATTGAPRPANTHPFLQDGRLFAHNGAIGGLSTLRARLEELGAASLVLGDTDSECVFALITAEIRRADTVRTGISSAVDWLQEHVPITSLNFVLAEPGGLWVFRYPATDGLVVRAVAAEAEDGTTTLLGSESSARTRGGPAGSSVVVASEPLDASADWRPLRPGELLHVGR